MPASNLDKAPRYFRAPVSRGLSEAIEDPIDRDGGRYKAGLIRGVSVITVGEALGHGMWIDETTLEQVASHINATKNGVKSRMAHPSLSGDGIGKHAARVSAAEVQGEQVFAEQHFLRSAHKGPDGGNLAEYLMNLAEEDPESYGISIVFMHDQEAERKFVEDGGGEIDEWGDAVGFTSPDPRNVNNFKHVRIAELRAADAVDEPAANPGGLFSSYSEGIAPEADRFAAYVLGLSKEKPDVSTLGVGIDPERARGFAARFINQHHKELTSMLNKTGLNETSPAEDPKPTTPPEQQPAGEATPSPTEPAATPAPTEEEEEKPADSAPEGDGQSQQSRKEFARFREAFGDKAADYYAQGLSFEDAQSRYNVALREENEKLRQQLGAAQHADGEAKPLGLSPQGDGERKGAGFASKIKIK